MTAIRYTERPNNTPEQIREYLREGLAVVDELDVPDDLRVVAFGKAVDLAASKQLTGEAIASAGMLLGAPRV